MIPDLRWPDFLICAACVAAIEADAAAYERMREAEGHPRCEWQADGTRILRPRGTGQGERDG